MLPEGLTLRTATREDAEAVAAFNGEIHGGQRYHEWTMDLLAGGHPTALPEDVFVVTEGDRIVASLLLIPQRWSYDVIELGIGQVEFVGTHPDYRRKGLVRVLMAAVHARAAERGLPVQVIGGIPWFYRQFGYAYALDLWAGRLAWRPQVERLEATEDVRVRPAVEAELPRIAAIAEAGQRRSFVRLVRSEALWRYELAGRREGSDCAYVIEAVEAGGDVAGVLVHSAKPGMRIPAIVACELAPGLSWLEAGPAVLRHCHNAAVAADGAYRRLFAGLGAAHPLYDACPDILGEPFNWASWYVRVPDLAGLLLTVAPALNRRLAGSVADGWSGEVGISWYRSGLRLVLDRGRITAVEPLADVAEATAALPYEQLLQLVFGFRSLDTLLRDNFDCTVSDRRARAVLAACFPSHASHVWGLG